MSNFRAVVVAQLAEKLLPIIEIHCSNPVIRELLTSGIKSDISTSWATTTSHFIPIFQTVTHQTRANELLPYLAKASSRICWGEGRLLTLNELLFWVIFHTNILQFGRFVGNSLSLSLSLSLSHSLTRGIRQIECNIWVKFWILSNSKVAKSILLNVPSAQDEILTAEIISWYSQSSL